MVYIIKIIYFSTIRFFTFERLKQIYEKSCADLQALRLALAEKQG